MSSTASARKTSSVTTTDRASVERQARLLDFLSDPPPEILAAAEAVGSAREHYGDDTDRELADIEAGRHPLQRRAKTAPGLMLPALDTLLEGFSRYAQRRRGEGAHDARAVGAALREAAKLAQGREPDEPAALFHALARRPRAFGKLQGDMLVLLAVEQARAVGLELAFKPIELDIHAIRILRGEMTFLELRGWFAARLTPIERRTWPPKKR